MCLNSKAILDTSWESQQDSGTALGLLRVRFEERLGKPMGVIPEPFLKPIGRANSTRGQPKKVGFARSFTQKPLLTTHTPLIKGVEVHPLIKG